MLLRLLALSLLPFLAAGQEFQCGTDKIQSDIAKTVVQFNCKDKVAEINKCCGAHDGCYDQQQPRTTCDASFCACVAAASAGNPLCGFYTTIFCDTTKVFGEAAYKKVGEEARKRREKREEEERLAAAAAAAAAANAAITRTTIPITTTTTTTTTAAPAAPAATTATTAAPKPEETKKAEVSKVLKNFSLKKQQGVKIDVRTEEKMAGESRHKQEKQPGDKPKEEQTPPPSSTSPPTPSTTSPSTTSAPAEREQTSSEEDREVADLEARLAREEADLERAEAEQRRVLAALAERKSALRAELNAFREAQRRLWKTKENEETVSASEDSTQTPSTTTVSPLQARSSAVVAAKHRAAAHAAARERFEKMQKLHDEQKAKALAAKTLQIQARLGVTTVAPEGTPKVTVTNNEIEGSGQEESVTASASNWSDDDLIPESE